jgi:hypothetical protein
LIASINPLAEANLWRNHQSVTRFVLRQYDSLVPVARERLAASMFLIRSEQVGYFVLVNASNNDTAIGELAILSQGTVAFVARHTR